MVVKGQKAQKVENMKTYENFASEFLMNEYGLSLHIPIKLNGRLTRSLGRHHGTLNRTTGERKTVGIELAKRLVEHYDEAVVLDVLKHELVHCALFNLNRAYRDGDRDFENELKRLKISATNVIQISDSEPQHHYGCDCQTHKTAKRLRKDISYSCKVCQAPLTYIGRY